ncbi:alpha/beta fold hydrolase [Streptomyces sp. S1D4-11]|nr:alpha/beta hydrolase [Streptomyces sp. S1D4-11]QIZ01119.1 alpha/beta hydrolase [Streptomyces sp. S1D4-11]
MNQSSSIGESATSGAGGVGQPTIVLVHGFLDDGHTWSEVAAGLPWASVPVELGDASAFTLEAFAEHVIAIVDNDVTGEVILVGQSMGSQVAELVSVRRPERVAGLVLMTPVPLQGVSLPSEMSEALRGCGGQRQLQRGLRTQLSAHLPEQKMLQLLDSGMRLSAAQVAETFDAWSGGHPEGAGPTRARGPIQIIAADNDPFVSSQLLDDLIMPRFPGASLVRIESSGHWPHVEQPAQVAEAISRFVAESVH